MKYVNYYLFDTNAHKENSVNQNNYELTEQEETIIDYIKQYGFIRRSTVEDILGVKTTRAYELLKLMVSKNLILQEGNNKSIKYHIK